MTTSINPYIYLAPILGTDTFGLGTRVDPELDSRYDKSQTWVIVCYPLVRGQDVGVRVAEALCTLLAHWALTDEPGNVFPMSKFGSALEILTTFAPSLGPGSPVKYLNVFGPQSRFSLINSWG
jgi:hypothetical protein